MKIKLYGLATCSRCKMAIKMLDKRNPFFEFIELTQEEAKNFKGELPQLSINGKVYEGKNVLLQIRKM